RRSEVQRTHFSLTRSQGRARAVCAREAVVAIGHLRENGGGDFQEAALGYAWAVADDLFGMDGLPWDRVRALLDHFHLLPGRVWPDPDTAGPIAEELMLLLEPALVSRRTSPRDDLFSTLVASGRDLEEL